MNLSRGVSTKSLLAHGEGVGTTKMTNGLQTEDKLQTERGRDEERIDKTYRENATELTYLTIVFIGYSADEPCHLSKPVEVSKFLFKTSRSLCCYLIRHVCLVFLESCI